MRRALPLLTLLLLAGLPAAAQTPDPPAPPAPILEEEVADPTPPPPDATAEATPPAATVDAGVFAPDRPEAGSVEQIRQFTTAPEYLPESVSYVPDSDTVPSPAEVLGHQVGAPGELSRVADVHGYFRKLDAASDRVTVRVVGTSEEGREILLAVISDPANLANLDRLQEINARLSDPRRTTREEARALAAEGKAVYYLRIDDRAVLSAPMTPVGEDPAPAGRVEGEGDIFLLRDTGQTALLTARVLLGAHQVDAAEVAFEARGVQYPPGSWIVQAPAEAVREVAAKTGLDWASPMSASG